MRSLSVRSRGFDDVPSGADSLLDFLFSRRQRIERHVQRTFRDFDFDYTVHRFDGVGYFLLAGGSPSSLISIRAAIVSLRLASAWSCLSFIFSQTVSCAPR
jgi:hypothetical protein